MGSVTLAPPKISIKAAPQAYFFIAAAQILVFQALIARQGTSVSLTLLFHQEALTLY